MNVRTATITSLARAFRRKDASPVDVVTALLKRIDEIDDQYRAFLYVCRETALAAAHAAEKALREQPQSHPLLGIPIAHKDILYTADAPTTAHSRLLSQARPTPDAVAVARLRAAGMIHLGKTNLSEFACGSTDIRGLPRNPWREGTYTGGSSGGSGAAVAAGLVPAATGSDTAGSIRVPASFCGLVGVKPTYGRVSTLGLLPLSWSSDHVGPMTHTVEDAALLLEGMAGHEAHDPRSAVHAVPEFTASLHKGVRGLRLGIPQQHFFEGLAPDVERSVLAAIHLLEEQGAELVPLDLPLAGDLAAAGSVLMMSEAYAVHADGLRRHPEQYGTRTRQRIAAGAFYTQADLHAARSLRHAWRRQLEHALSQVSAIVTPTLPLTAFSLEQQIKDPPDTSWGTRHFSLSGHPALSVPCGLDETGLPIGLQIAADHFDEATLFRIAQVVEDAQTDLGFLFQGAVHVH
jgi:aspartyl-tRNA(Asn)/glutamyl-tRNA(Gln) amidotransferase subunit A